MGVFVRIIIITFCLCASPRLLDSLSVPVQIGNLRENEVMELLMLCDKFVNLKMRDGSIYTATNERQIAYFPNTYIGTAMFVDYDIPVLNKTLLEIWQDMTFRHLLTEISLRIINVVESVGVFILIKISMLAHDIMILSRKPHVLLRTIILHLGNIDNKFYQLTIPRTPIEDLREIMQPYTYTLNYSPTEKANFQSACIRFIDKYSYLRGFVDIGDINLTNFDPNTITIEEFLNVQLVFIRSKVNSYFLPFDLGDH